MTLGTGVVALAENGVEAGFIESVSPWQNGYIKSTFGKLRDELLNMEIFPTGKDLNAHLDDFQENTTDVIPTPHLGALPPQPTNRR